MKLGHALALGLAWTCAGAGASEQRLVVVSGSCTRQVEPDRASLVLTAEFLDKDASKAMRQASEAYEATRRDVKALGLSNLELVTVELSTQAQNDWVKDHNVFKGYKSRLGLRVTTSDTRKLGEVIPVAAARGIRDVGQMTTFLSDETLRKSRAGCLKAAVEDARAKAEQMTEGLGQRLGPAQSVHELSASSPRPVPMMMAKGAGLADSAELRAPEVEGGKQAVEAHVEVSFELGK